MWVVSDVIHGTGQLIAVELSLCMISVGCTLPLSTHHYMGYTQAKRERDENKWTKPSVPRENEILHSL